MATSSKESVYITVESLGVQQAADSMRDLTGPLEAVAKAVTALEKQQGALKASSTGALDLTKKLQAGVQQATGAASSLKTAAGTATKAATQATQASAKLVDVQRLLPGLLGKTAGALTGGQGLATALSGATAKTLTSDAAMGGFVTALGAVNPVAIAAGIAIGGAVLSVVKLYKGAKDLTETFDKLNPEARTIQDAFRETEEQGEALSLALKSMAGEQINDLLLPAVESVTGAFKEFRAETARLLAVFSQKDKETGISGFASALVGTYIEIKYSLGLATKEELAAQEQAAESFYNSTVQGEQKLKDQVKRAEDLIAKTKGLTAQAQDTAPSKSGAKDKKQAPAFRRSDIDGGGLRLWSVKSLEGYKEIKAAYEQQLKELELLQGDPAVVAATRVQIEAEAQQKLKDIVLQNARETNDQKLLLQEAYNTQQKLLEDQRRAEDLQKAKEYQDQLKAQELQRLAEIEQAEKEKQEAIASFVSDIKNAISGSLTSSIMGAFEAAQEGTLDVRSSLFEMFQSLAKNIFSTAMSQVINAVVDMAMNAGSSAAKVPVIGPALAAAAVSGTLAMGLAIAKRNVKTEAQVQYSTGGYISQGLVIGASGSGDSVQALLEPGERVLSKQETLDYDSGRSSGKQIIFNNYFTFNGQLSTQSQLDQWTRMTFIPALRRAVSQGYTIA